MYPFGCVYLKQCKINSNPIIVFKSKIICMQHNLSACSEKSNSKKSLKIPMAFMFLTRIYKLAADAELI